MTKKLALKERAGWVAVSKAIEELKIAETESEKKSARLAYVREILLKREKLLVTAQMDLHAVEFSKDEKLISRTQERLDLHNSIVDGLKNEILELTKPLIDAKENVKATAEKSINKLPRISLENVVNEVSKISATLQNLKQMFEYEDGVEKIHRQANRVYISLWGSYRDSGYELKQAILKIVSEHEKLAAMFEPRASESPQVEGDHDGDDQESEQRFG